LAADGLGGSVGPDVLGHIPAADQDGRTAHGPAARCADVVQIAAALVEDGEDGFAIQGVLPADGGLVSAPVLIVVQALHLPRVQHRAQLLREELPNVRLDLGGRFFALPSRTEWPHRNTSRSSCYGREGAVQLVITRMSS